MGIYFEVSFSLKSCFLSSVIKANKEHGSYETLKLV